MGKRGKILSFFKKGQVESELFFIIIEIILVLGIAITFFSFVNSIAKNTMIEKNYFSRDLALLIDVIYSSPGDIYYNYFHEEDDVMNKFNFLFDEQKVEVSEAEIEQKPLPVSYPYADSLIFGKKVEKIEEPRIIEIIKIENEVSIIKK